MLSRKETLHVAPHVLVGPWKSGLDLSGPFDLNAYLMGQNMRSSGNIFLRRNRQKVVAQGRVPSATMTGASRRGGREVEGALVCQTQAWAFSGMPGRTWRWIFFLRDGHVVKDLASLLMFLYFIIIKGHINRSYYTVCV